MPAHQIERLLPDRRQRPTPALSRYWLRGGRRAGRRDDELQCIYVDRYSPLEASLFVALVTLSLTDLILTLVHVNAGGAEANPVMAWFLAQGGAPGFSVAKLILTLGGALVLLVHIRFPGVRRILTGLVGVYLALIIYHGYVAWDRAQLLA